MKENAERWLSFAREDLAAAKSVARDSLFNQVCFHCQQCVEKALKALIAEKGDVPPKTHSVVDLLSFLSESDLPPRLCLEMRDFDAYYIPTRYPDAIPGALPEGLPDETDATRCIDLAEQCLCSALKLMA